MNKYLFEDSEWNFDIIQDIVDEIMIINDEELGIDIYPNSFEIISSEQMLDAYTSVGMPINYKHWSFGKQFINEKNKYNSKYGSLAFEIVVNTNPAINYLMEDNSATIQAVVLGHAGVGHNGFFKNNYLFKTWTEADSIIDYMNFARKYIEECEMRYGEDAVEEILDSCHALRYHGTDRYKKPTMSPAREKERLSERLKHAEENFDYMVDNFVSKDVQENDRFPQSTEENVLKFIEKNSPSLAEWQREIIRITRKINQYFYPQIQTKVANEGFATWTHTYIMNRLYEKGLISEGSMMEFIDVNASVKFQPDHTHRGYSGFNPYALGYAIYEDIHRICTDPTDEDREWFPDLVGKDPIEEIKYAAYNFRDESFILQYLSPKVMRDFQLFSIGDHDEDFFEVTNIHNDNGYKGIRRKLSRQYQYGNMIPDIQVYNSNLEGDRTLELHHYMVKNMTLDSASADECMKHLKRLWGFDVILVSLDENGEEKDIKVTGV